MNNYLRFIRPLANVFIAIGTGIFVNTMINDRHSTNIYILMGACIGLVFILLLIDFLLQQIEKDVYRIIQKKIEKKEKVDHDAIWKKAFKDHQGVTKSSILTSIFFICIACILYSFINWKKEVTELQEQKTKETTNIQQNLNEITNQLKTHHQLLREIKDSIPLSP